MRKTICNWGRSSISGLRFPSIGGDAIIMGITMFLAFQAGCGSRQPSASFNPKAMLSAHSSATPSARKGDEHEAKVLGEALKKRPDHVPVLLRLASLSLEAGKSDEAAKYLTQVLKQEPGNVPARVDLGKILFETGKIPEAIQTTEEILKVQPDNPDALYNLGAIYGNLGQKERALKFWNRLLAVSPQSESGKRAQQMMAELRKVQQ